MTGRVGSVRGRSGVLDPKQGLWDPRDTTSGRFVQQQTRGGSFSGVIKEDGRWHRMAGRRLARHRHGLQASRVGWLRWLLRWGGQGS